MDAPDVLELLKPAALLRYEQEHRAALAAISERFPRPIRTSIVMLWQFTRCGAAKCAVVPARGTLELVLEQARTYLRGVLGYQFSIYRRSASEYYLFIDWSGSRVLEELLSEDQFRQMKREMRHPLRIATLLNDTHIVE